MYESPKPTPREESRLTTILMILLGIFAGLAFPTAFAIWMGWLDPILR